MRACLASFVADLLAHLIVLLGAAGTSWGEEALLRIYFQVCGTTLLAAFLCLPLWFNALAVRNFGWALVASLLVVDIAAYAHHVNTGFPPGIDELHYLATPLQVLGFAGTALVAPVLALLAGLGTLFGLRQLSRRGTSTLALNLRLAVLLLVGIACSGVWPVVVDPNPPRMSPIVATLFRLLRFEQSLPRQSPLAAAEILQRLTRGAPLVGATPTEPLCGGKVSAAPSSRAANTLLVVLMPGVGREEFELVVDQRPVFARVHELRGRGVSMQNIVAPGRSLDDALLALLTAQPPLLGPRSLSSGGGPRGMGLATVLGESGYETAFLSSERALTEARRELLRRAGFELVIGARGLPTPTEGGQPGSSASRLLAEVEPTLEVMRVGDDERPALLVVMLEEESSASGALSSPEAAQAHLAATDVALAAFLERVSLATAGDSRVTMLVGTHVPPRRNTIRAKLGVPLAFDVPLLVFGLEAEADALSRQYRLGSLNDVSATLTRLAGLPPGRCDNGVDLFAERGSYPSERLVYAVVPEEEEIYVFLTSKLYWRYSLRGGVWTMAKELKGQELLEVLLPLGQEHPDPRLALTAAEAKRQQLVEVIAPLSRWEAARATALASRQGER